MGRRTNGLSEQQAVTATCNLVVVMFVDRNITNDIL